MRGEFFSSRQDRNPDVDALLARGETVLQQGENIIAAMLRMQNGETLT